MLITNKGLLSFIRFCRLFGILILFTGWLGSTAVLVQRESDKTGVGFKVENWL